MSLKVPESRRMSFPRFREQALALQTGVPVRLRDLHGAIATSGPALNT
jgi:hypothetical protein